MRLFSRLYDLAIRWAAHRHAPRYLCALSFAESSFFPIPPDVMLAPMVVAKRAQAWRYALMTTVASVLGGLFGYLIGALAIDLAAELIQQAGLQAKYLQVQAWFSEWGFWAVFLAGFSPIPYKLFTIAAGAGGMALLPFVLASTIGRGARFFLVASLIWSGGPRFEPILRRYIDYFGWLVVLLAIVLYGLFG